MIEAGQCRPGGTSNIGSAGWKGRIHRRLRRQGRYDPRPKSIFVAPFATPRSRVGVQRLSISATGKTQRCRFKTACRANAFVAFEHPLTKVTGIGTEPPLFYAPLGTEGPAAGRELPGCTSGRCRGRFRLSEPSRGPRGRPALCAGYSRLPRT